MIKLRVNNKRYRSQSEELDDWLSKVAPRTGIAVMRAIEDQILEATPVDTGRFKASWVASFGRPRSLVAGTDEEQKLSKGRETFVRPTKFTGEKVWGRNAERVRNKRLVLSNALPYGVKLSEGYSPQAEAGWISSAARRGRARWRKYFNELGFNRK